MAQTFYTENLAESSTTGTAWVDNANLSFTPDDNSTYFYFQSAALALTSTANDAKHQFLNSSLIFGKINAEARDVTDYVPVFSLGVESFTTGHGTQTLKSQISSETAGITTKIKEDRIVVLKKSENDDYAVSSGDSTTISSTYQDKISKNITPATTGDYLIIAFCNRHSNAAGINTTCCLDIDGTIYGEAGHSVADVNTYRAWGTMAKVNLTDTTHTIKLKFKSNGTATATVNNATIIILRLSDFNNNYYAEDLVRETVTTNTFTTQANLTVASPANQEHVVFACAQYDHGGTTTSTSVRLQEVASSNFDFTEILEEPVNAGSSNIFSWFVAYRKTLVTESHTWNIQHHNESGTVVSGIKNKVIAVLQTGGNSAIFKTASLQAVLEKQNIMRISSTNASLQKQDLLKTTNIDAKLAKAFLVASSLNVNLQKAVQVITSAESLLQKKQGSNTSIQGLIEKHEITLTSTLNAAMQKTTMLTTSLNAIINASVNPQVSSSLNALLTKIVQANATLDILLSKQGIICIVLANAVLLKTVALNMELSGLLQKLATLVVSINGLKLKPDIPVITSINGALVIFETLTAHRMVKPSKQTYLRSKPKRNFVKPRAGLLRPH